MEMRGAAHGLCMAVAGYEGCVGDAINFVMG
jgi:hypothetical protein